MQIAPDYGGVLLLLALIGIIALDNMRGGRGLYRVDIVTQYLPWYTYLGEQLRSGNIPGWAPFNFSGAPFAGDPQSGWMYLPAMAIFSLVGGVTGFKVFITFHLLLAGLSTYALARVLGVGVLGAVVAGSAYTFTGFLERTRCCTIHAEVAVWIPVAFLGVEYVTRARTRRGQFAGLCVVGFTISQMLAGWLGQGAYYGLLAVGTYLAYRTLVTPPTVTYPARERITRLIVFGAVMLAIGFGIAAAGILPRLDVVARTPLAEGYEGATRTWAISELIDRLLSLEIRFGRWYAGAATLSVAALAPFVARRRAETRFWVGYSLGVLALVFATLPIFWPLYQVLPRFQGLHQHLPERVLTVFFIGPALLAGMAVDGMVAALPSSRRLMRFGASIGTAAVVSLSIQWGHDVTISWLPLSTLAAVAVILVVSARLPQAWAHRWLPLSLLLLVFLDPAGIHAITRLDGAAGDGWQERTVKDYTEPGGAGAFLLSESSGDAEPFRFFGYDPALLLENEEQRTYVISYADPRTAAILAINRSFFVGLQDIQGYSPVQSSRYVELMDAANGVEQSYHTANILKSGWPSPLLDLLNVRFIVVPSAVPPGRPDLLHLSQLYATVYRDDEVRVVERPSPLPRAWIVHEALQVADSEMLPMFESGEFDPRRTALLSTEETVPPLANRSDTAMDHVDITAYHGDELRIEAELAADGLLMLSEMFDPGWRAYVDGSEVPILRADYLLRGIPVPAGAHIVELRYEPASLRTGLAISAGTLLALAAAGAVMTVRGGAPLPLPAPAGAPIATPWAPGRRRRATWAGPPADAWRFVHTWDRIGDRVAFGAVLIAAAVLRLTRLDSLSFRIDEGYTLLYSRQSWPAVLGLDGYYDFHPPLYYSLAKLANVFVREEIAARSVAAVAGVATVAVFYAIVRRLLDSRAALAASALLAVAPLHVEFSRDGRMYAPVVLMVAVGYLALVAYWGRPSRGWAVVYGVALVLAVYLDYSAAYGLVPQAVLLAAIARRHGRRARWLIAATVVAALAYLPWFPQLVRTVRSLDGSIAETDRANVLAASWQRIGDSIPIIAGFNSRGSSGDTPNAWDRWSADRALMLVVLLVVTVIGTYAMRSRARGAVVGGLLMLGTVLTSIGMSLVSPGFAPKTLVPSVLGLCLIAGACLQRSGSGHMLPRGVRTVGAIGWGVLMLTSVATLPATLSESGRYDWREITDLLASQSHLHKPIVLHSSAGMLTDIIDLYEEDRLDEARWITITHGQRESLIAADRWVSRGPTVDQVDDGALTALLPVDDTDVDAFWYVSRLAGTTVTTAFAELGYTELMTTQYRGANLSLYARPGAALGVALDVNGDFLGEAASARSWRSSDDSARFTPDGDEGRTLVLDGAQREARLSRRVDSAPIGLYTMRGDVLVNEGARAQLSVKCQSAEREDLAVSTRIVDAADAGKVRHVQLAVICPSSTASVLLAATRLGPGRASFADISLLISPPSSPNDSTQETIKRTTPTAVTEATLRGTPRASTRRTMRS